MITLYQDTPDVASIATIVDTQREKQSIRSQSPGTIVYLTDGKPSVLRQPNEPAYDFGTIAVDRYGLHIEQQIGSPLGTDREWMRDADTLGANLSGASRLPQHGRYYVFVPDEQAAFLIHSWTATQKAFQARTERERQLNEYIWGLSEKKQISSTTANNARSMWKRIATSTDNAICVPDASAGPNGEFAFIWDRGEHHLELEVMPDSTVEFFYRNRSTGALWGQDSSVSNNFPLELFQKLEHFA